MFSRHIALIAFLFYFGAIVMGRCESSADVLDLTLRSANSFAATAETPPVNLDQMLDHEDHCAIHGTVLIQEFLVHSIITKSIPVILSFPRSQISSIQEQYFRPPRA